MKRTIVPIMILTAAALALSACGVTPYVENAPVVETGPQIAEEPPSAQIVPNGDALPPVVAPAPANLSLTPLISAEMTEDGQANIKLGIYNYGVDDFTSDTFTGTYSIIDETGTVVAEGTVASVDAVVPMSEAYPVDWTGDLTAGTYRVEWSAPEMGSLVGQVTIGEGDDGTLAVDDVLELSTSAFPLPQGMNIPQ